MTKFREPATFERALTVVAGLIGWDACAHICGVSTRAVRFWSDPDTDVAIRLVDARRLDEAYLKAGGEHPPFYRVYALQLELGGMVSDDEAKALSTVAGSAAKESGEAINALLLAAAPGAGPAVRRKARRETKEAIESLHRGLAVLGEDGD